MAKKKTTPRGRPKDYVPWTEAERIAGLERALLDEQSISKIQTQAIQENARVIAALNEELAALRKMFFELNQQLTARKMDVLADEAEMHFWITEYERWRDRVVEYERLHATLPAEARHQVVLAKYKEFKVEPDAMAHPDTLGDVGELIEGDDKLLEGVDP